MTKVDLIAAEMHSSIKLQPIICLWIFVVQYLEYSMDTWKYTEDECPLMRNVPLLQEIFFRQVNYIFY